MKITLKNIIVIALAAFIVISLLFLPYLSMSAPISGESDSASFTDILDGDGDTGVIVTFTIFSLICAVGMAITSVLNMDMKIVIGLAVAGILMLFIATLDFPEDIEYGGKVALEFGCGAGIWLAWLSYIAVGALSYLKLPALEKTFN